jgi:hypothetical protein
MEQNLTALPSLVFHLEIDLLYEHQFRLEACLELYETM